MPKVLTEAYHLEGSSSVLPSSWKSPREPLSCPTCGGRAKAGVWVISSHPNRQTSQMNSVDNPWNCPELLSLPSEH